MTRARRRCRRRTWGRDFIGLLTYCLFLEGPIGTGPLSNGDPPADYCPSTAFFLMAAAFVDLTARFTGGADAANHFGSLLVPAACPREAGPPSGGGATTLAPTRAPNDGGPPRGRRVARTIVTS